MKHLKVYAQKNIDKFLKLRKGEVKLGEKLKFILGLDGLEKSSAGFVIFGIPEDIGVRANHGKAGAAGGWETFLGSFVNLQCNRFIADREILLLGEIDTSFFMHKAANIDVSDPNYHQKLGDLVVQLDQVVAEVVTAIVSAGKKPVIIGGGHNNAFGNIKGSSKATGRKINVLNIDAHTDLRTTDIRHSGNGFSFALEKGFLEKYAVFGLQENYTPEYIFEEMQRVNNLHYHLFEDIAGKQPSKFEESLDFVKDDAFGFEVDCDSIANFPSSAMSPSGFTLDEVREFVSRTAKEKKCLYLHLCEATGKGSYPTGKALSYLVTDFIKNSSE